MSATEPASPSQAAEALAAQIGVTPEVAEHTLRAEASSKNARPKNPLAGTEYVLLRQTGSGPEYWEVLQTVIATSAGAAIRHADPGSGLYVATPARSFRPVRVSVQTVSRVKLEDA